MSRSFVAVDVASSRRNADRGEVRSIVDLGSSLRNLFSLFKLGTDSIPSNSLNQTETKFTHPCCR